MKNKALAYLTSTINQYQRAYEIEDSCTASNVINDLKDFETFLIDLNEDTTDNTLELNADLTENVRAYKISLAVERRVVDSLKIDLNDKIMDLHKNGYIEQENIRLEADNLKLNNQLALQETKRKELFQECWEAEIENGKYIMEIQDLKTDNQMWQAKCIELREKIEKLTGPHWVD